MPSLVQLSGSDSGETAGGSRDKPRTYEKSLQKPTIEKITRGEENERQKTGKKTHNRNIHMEPAKNCSK